MSQAIVPVILCGGSGTRLWPLSRKSYPKQFGRILGEKSLFQQTVERFPDPDFAAPIIVTNSEFRFIATEQMAGIGRAAGAVLIEPDGRNTGPAVLAAALKAAELHPDGILLVCPSDHAIPDSAAFRETALSGLESAKEGNLVTFGIAPSRPETGYGYLELHDPLDMDAAPKPVSLKNFVEKPDLATAEAMLAGGRHLWNSGIFLFSVPAVIRAFETHQPEMTVAVRAAVAQAQADLNFLRLDPEAWSRAPSNSIDYAIMEKSSNLAVVPFAAEWSDLGSWDAISRAMGPDETGVALGGDAHAIDCENTLLRSESDDQTVIGIGLKNIVAVAMHDAVLVADITEGQRVKEAVDLLKTKGRKQATEFPRYHRPWGWYETLSLGSRFQVKRIMVHPGGQLSLQSHVHRSEHWVVVQGAARVTNAATETPAPEDVHLLTENQSIYIPVGNVHRLENPGKVDLHLIEVQSGPYLGEDDIIRYEDVYART
ncbi:mannose-1-phosphate guanylyltransferase/mannose-6-phosphate isomerase [Amaricoccus macauensis]|uniref:mannose-1-phosphate guanylyltransferase/mannose-6-phosphate isomerase n=1 Tax=Amaricoccus macauensis TaxID=57001 RepID=UPI003C7BA770